MVKLVDTPAAGAGYGVFEFALGTKVLWALCPNAVRAFLCRHIANIIFDAALAVDSLKAVYCKVMLFLILNSLCISNRFLLKFFPVRLFFIPIL